MTDDKRKTGKPDRSRISLKEPYEIQYWKRRFGVSVYILTAVIEKVGHMVADVEAELLSACIGLKVPKPKNRPKKKKT